MGTKGAGSDDRDFSGDAVDTGVEEVADDQTDEKKDINSVIGWHLL